MNAAPVDYQLLYEQALIAQQQALEERRQLEAKNQELAEKLALALFEITKMRWKLFGRSADNRSKAADPNQLPIFDLGPTLEDLQAIEAETKSEVEKANQDSPPATDTTKPPAKKRKENRMVLPADLPREEVIIHPTQDLTNYIRIGEEVTEILEITPAAFFVKRIIRTRWALKASVVKESNPDDMLPAGVIMAPIPSRTVAKGLLGESLLAHLIISKYTDHLPLHRQIKIFERSGIRLAASTLSDNVADVSKLLEPLYNCLKREVLKNLYLQADETGIRVLDSEKKGATHSGFFWTYHAPVSKLVLFDYQKGKGQEGPKDILKDFEGVLQTDGYQVYGKLFDNSTAVTLAACMAHVRRKFDEAVGYDANRAKYVVAEISKLYAIEKAIRDNPELKEIDITQKRILEAAPILDKLHCYLEGERSKVLPESPIGKAIAYALKLWERLTVYLYHGQLQIDNNLIEKTIRPIALGRKNYLFCGSHTAAQNTAMIYSLLGSCQLNGVNPQEWLEDVLFKLNDSQYEGKFSDLLPNHWKKYNSHLGTNSSLRNCC